MSDNPLREAIERIIWGPINDPRLATTAILADPTVAALVRFAACGVKDWAAQDEDEIADTDQAARDAYDALPDDLRDWLRGQT